jgi:tetratricopeptide (TPR) repeat protein
VKRPALLLALVLSLGAWAQVVPEREVDLARQLYDVGKFADALKRARDAMGLTNFTDEQRLRLHEIAGLSAFNLGDAKAAQQHFLQLLQINPDYQLDPFAVAPPGIKLFEQVRRENADALALARQQIALRADQAKRDLAERERKRVEDEERRRRAEQLAQGVTVRTVEKHPFLLNLLPFGAGQFLQGRVGWGVAFAVSEAVLALTSVISWLAINALYETRTDVLCCYLSPDGTGRVTVTVRGIPTARHVEYEVWSVIKYATGGAFYGAWALGVVDAVLHHSPETITETQERLKPTAHLNLSPTSGGLSAGLTITF